MMEDGSMWLENGIGFYRANGLPMIKNHSQMAAVLDLEKGKANGITFHQEDYMDYKGPSIAEWDPTELLTKKIKMLAVKDEEAYSCVKAGKELLFYNDWYLTPLADVKKNSEYLQLTVRIDHRGQMWLTVKDGMIVVGMVQTVKLISEQYIDDLHEFLGECQMQLEREKAREAQEEDEEQEKPRA